VKYQDTTSMAKSHGYYTKMNVVMKQWRKTKMNEKLRKVLIYRYNAEIQDALYKIQCFSEQELLIPEHPDITAEVDKLLQKIAEAEDKMAVMELHYDQNVADKTVL
jgi:hypothetical protein